MATTRPAVSPVTPAVSPVTWTGRSLRLLDQTALPARVAYLDLDEVDGVIDAIRRLVVRGAPALGVAGAYGVAVAAAQAEREGWDADRLGAALDRLRAARPTAVALAAGVDAARARVPDGLAAVVAAADRLREADERANRAVGRHGADWVLEHAPRRPLRVLTHCNTGALATAGWGTALGVIFTLHARGVLEMVYVDETRPALQGSRLTAWELAGAGIPHRVQVDGAAAGMILGGMVDAVLVGADRVAANGDVANKVGTVGLALACADAGIPFVVAATAATVDPHTPSGAQIRVELRDEDEVLRVGGLPAAPAGTRAYNPAFDITPARLVGALVTEAGVLTAGELAAGLARA